MDSEFKKCTPCKGCPICYKKIKSGDPIIKRVLQYTVFLLIVLVISIIYNNK